jgi:hypothetical protein
MRDKKNVETATLDENTCSTTPYPFNFSSLREGCIDPCLRKKVQWLIASDDDYVVYVDEDNYVEWTMNDNSLLVDYGAQLTRVGALESAQTKHLRLTQIETYKRLIGEAVARLFEKNGAAADIALNTAELWIRARGQEAARVASLKGATLVFGATALVFTIAWFWSHAVFGGGRSMVTLGTMLGCVGSWLSVLQRTGREDFDIGAGQTLFFMEGMVRIAIGAVGGLFVALLLQSGWLLPDATHTPALFAAMCLVAGLSERLVNSLASGLEGRAQLPRPTTTTNGGGSQPPSNSSPAPTAPAPDSKLPPAELDGIVSLSLDNARAGDSLTIEGHKFGAAQGTVTIGGTPANVRKWSDVSIEIVVPAVAAGAADVRVEPPNAERPFVAKDALRVV